MRTEFDAVVIGGGINGAGIARDLAGRGLSVMLCEQHDLASHTSSASTKLIHGGLRYLEYFEFGLVRKALQEREVLLCNAPHIMWPLRFVMPHDRGMRPSWMIRLGLFLYDHLAKRNVLPASQGINLQRHPAGEALKPVFSKGFEYSDGWVDDARLVVLNALDAHERGATIMTQTACVDAIRSKDHWTLTLQSGFDASQTHGTEPTPLRIKARALVNAAGPWAAKFLQMQAHRSGTRPLRLVKGSHLVVKKLFTHDFAYIFQNTDRRISFAIPYETDFTLIGTTDVNHQGEIGTVEMDQAECAYICEQVGRYLRQTITSDDVIWSYSGVRPLLDDASGNPSAVTRDYRLDLDTEMAPLLSVWGGKITTYRKLAEQAAELLAPFLSNQAPAWTAKSPLPGGDLGPSTTLSQHPAQDFNNFVAATRNRYGWLPESLCVRYARTYGTRLNAMLTGATRLSDLGSLIAPGLYDVELRYLVKHEWARQSDDVLWRRTKLGLHINPSERQAVEQWFKDKGVREQCA